MAAIRSTFDVVQELTKEGHLTKEEGQLFCRLWDDIKNLRTSGNANKDELILFKSKLDDAMSVERSNHVFHAYKMKYEQLKNSNNDGQQHIQQQQQQGKGPQPAPWTIENIVDLSKYQVLCDQIIAQKYGLQVDKYTFQLLSNGLQIQLRNIIASCIKNFNQRRNRTGVVAYEKIMSKINSSTDNTVTDIVALTWGGDNYNKLLKEEYSSRKKIVDFDILLEDAMQKTLLNIDETKASKKKADLFNLMTKINDEKNGLLTIDDLCELHAKEEIAKKFESRKKMRLNLNQTVGGMSSSSNPPQAVDTLDHNEYANQKHAIDVEYSKKVQGYALSTSYQTQVCPLNQVNSSDNHRITVFDIQKVITSHTDVTVTKLSKKNMKGVNFSAKSTVSAFIAR